MIFLFVYIMCMCVCVCVCVRACACACNSLTALIKFRNTRLVSQREFSHVRVYFLMLNVPHKLSRRDRYDCLHIIASEFTVRVGWSTSTFEGVGDPVVLCSP